MVVGCLEQGLEADTQSVAACHQQIAMVVIGWLCGHSSKSSFREDEGFEFILDC